MEDRVEADFSFITDRLAIGNVESRRVPGFVAVVSVITVRDRPGIAWVELPERKHPSDLAKQPQVPPGIPVHFVDIADGESEDLDGSMMPQRDRPGHAHKLEDFLEQATSFISEHIKNGPVLVHCGAGHSRSAAVVAAYLCRYLGMRLDEAVAFIASRRPSICPAEVFKRAIGRWMKLEELAMKGPRIGRKEEPR